LQDLREQVELSKSQIHKLNLTIVDMHDSVTELKRKVKEISTVNDIILGVQQSLLEELSFAAQHAQQQQKKAASIFSVGGNDDDDLPN
jgi:ABC-type thiamine transport system substrate-binding protein